MIIYVNKKKLEQFQVIPIPKELNNYFLVNYDGAFEDIFQNEFIVDNGICKLIPSDKYMIQKNIHQQEQRLNEALKKIAPLQDMVDLNKATEKEIQELVSWKKYRIELSRLNLSLVNKVEWPEKPQ
ncbi:MAG: tail fiber assembly protein [Proteus vulgaris]